MANTAFITPGEDRYFEDYVPNTVHTFGPISVVQDEVNSFVNCFARHNTHTESVSPKKKLFGSLVASECPIDESMTRLLTDYYLPEAGNLSSPEITELRWIRPICPGEELILGVTVTGSLRSSSEPDRGTVHSFIEVQNQNRVVVMSMRMKNISFCLPK
jgi:acyl dehydratase